LGKILPGSFGRASAGLAHFHMDDIAACLFGGAGSSHDIHHDKGIDYGPA
jgi:hypothetical protein